MMKKIYTILVCLCMLASFVACEKDKEFVLTTLSVTSEVLAPTYEAATIQCKLSADATISEAYVHYSLTSSFEDYEEVKMTLVNENYSALLLNLADNTTYYIRYEVSNKYSQVMSKSVNSFKTERLTTPTVLLGSLSEIQETQAKVVMSVVYDGGSSVTEMGVCWSTSSNPTKQNSHTRYDGFAIDAVLEITDLQPNTTYYVRAYAVNKVGVAYSEERSFTTLSDVQLPTLSTSTITQITETSAVAGGNVTSDGNASVTERGVVYSTNPNPVITNLYHTIKPCGSGIGSFTCDLTNLQPNTTYYVCAYATNSIGTAYGEEVSFTTKENISDPTGTENGYGYVDLGLSVKWATCNVGADTPEEYGDYFAWGETEPKETYDDDNYKWFTSDLGYTKYYNGTVGTGILDNRKTMEPSDDVATVNWGGNWRVPTREELTELETNCTWTLTTQSGISGYRVTSKKAGYTNKSIFIPLAGKRSGYYKEHVGELALYWSSSLYLYECSSAFVLYNDECINTDMNRYTGLTIRPVYGPRVEEVIALPTVITHAVTALESNYALIMYEILDDGGSNVTDAGVVYGLSTNPTILDNKVSFEKHPNDKFECDLYDLQPNTTYYVRAYATNEMGTAYGEEVSFTTKEESNTPSNGTENGYEYVDLGLSVKWATCNVGANSPEEYGDYFAWGEVEPKSIYDWGTYKYCNGSESTLTKYNTVSSQGTVDNKTTLELSDDAARVNWGGSWRMPTDAELTELRAQCTWTWTTQNGVKGYNMTSKKNGNSIFLPASGFHSDSPFFTTVVNIGISGSYWSSSLHTDDPGLAWSVSFTYLQQVNRGSGNRDCGFSVRPVCQ